MGGASDRITELHAATATGTGPSITRVNPYSPTCETALALAGHSVSVFQEASSIVQLKIASWEYSLLSQQTCHSPFPASDRHGKPPTAADSAHRIPHTCRRIRVKQTDGRSLRNYRPAIREPRDVWRHPKRQHGRQYCCAQCRIGASPMLTRLGTGRDWNLYGF